MRWLVGPLHDGGGAANSSPKSHSSQANDCRSRLCHPCPEMTPSVTPTRRLHMLRSFNEERLSTEHSSARSNSEADWMRRTRTKAPSARA